MMMHPVTILAGGAARCLRALGATGNGVFFEGGAGVGGFVDSGPKMPISSAPNRFTSEWTVVDFRRTGRGGPTRRTTFNRSRSGTGGRDGEDSRRHKRKEHRRR